MNAEAMILFRKFTQRTILFALLGILALQPGCASKYPKGCFVVLEAKLDAAAALFAKGEYRRAEAKYREVLRFQERVDGPEHPKTLQSRNALARTLYEQGKSVEAEAEFRAIIKLLERVLGPEHSDTLAIRNNLTGPLIAQGRVEEAEAENRTVLKLRERTLGSEHPDTVQSLYNLARCLQEQGKLEEAREFARLAAEGARKIYPVGHPNRKAFEALYQNLTPKK